MKETLQLGDNYLILITSHYKYNSHSSIIFDINSIHVKHLCGAISTGV